MDFDRYVEENLAHRLRIDDIQEGVRSVMRRVNPRYALEVDEIMRKCVDEGFNPAGDGIFAGTPQQGEWIATQACRFIPGAFVTSELRTGVNATWRVYWVHVPGLARYAEYEHATRIISSAKIFTPREYLTPGGWASSQACVHVRFENYDGYYMALHNSR